MSAPWKDWIRCPPPVLPPPPNPPPPPQLPASGQFTNEQGLEIVTYAFNPADSIRQSDAFLAVPLKGVVIALHGYGSHTQNQCVSNLRRRASERASDRAGCVPSLAPLATNLSPSPPRCQVVLRQGAGHGQDHLPGQHD